MKYNYSIFLSVLLLLGFVFGCNEDDTNEVQIPLKLEKEVLNFSNEGGEQKFSIQVSGRWSSSTESAWIRLEPLNGDGSTTCILRIDTSVMNADREGVIYFSSETGERKKLEIFQGGFDKSIVPITLDTLIENSAPYGERFTEFEVRSNVNFTAHILDVSDSGVLIPAKAEWISCENVDDFDFSKTGARPVSAKLRFEWKNNFVPQERKALVQLISEELEDTVRFHIRQKGGPEITDDAAGDSVAIRVIMEKMNVSVNWNLDAAMEFWPNVILWEKTDDEVKTNPEMRGRVRKLQIRFFATKETPPVEFKFLKYLEHLELKTNMNSIFLEIDLSKEEDGIGALENLKQLHIFSYGLVGELPDSWRNLKNLETLFLEANGFAKVPRLLTPQNFPSLKHLSFTANKRGSSVSLNPLSGPLDEIGLHVMFDKDYNFKRLFKWEKLEYLSFSNCVLEGKIPKANELYIYDRYTAADVADRGDTLQYIIGKPKVMPNLKILRLNLNFLNGEIPDWILYHPNLRTWNPWILVFNQEGGKLNQAGEEVGFDNRPLNWDYYWEVYPLLKPSIN